MIRRAPPGPGRRLSATVLIGVVVLAWPGATLTVLTTVFGVFAVLTGIFHLAAVFAPAEPGGGLRALLGVVSLISGVVLLRRLADTWALLTVLVGLFWVVEGALESGRRAVAGPPRPA